MTQVPYELGFGPTGFGESGSDAWENESPLEFDRIAFAGYVCDAVVSVSAAIQAVFVARCGGDTVE